MAISDKLNYLIETKQLFKDRLNSLGAEIIESTTFRNYLNWLDTFYGEVSDKTDLSINGVVGRTSQENTTGKNLQPPPTTSITTCGVTFTPIFENGMLQYVNANGTSTDVAYIDLPKFRFNAGTYIITGSPNGGSDNSYQQRFVTGDSNLGTDNGDGISVTLNTATSCRIRIRIASGYTANNLKFYPMVRLASITDATYEPYTGGEPSPSPDYPQEINNLSGDVTYKVRGKNLFDKSKATAGKGVSTSTGNLYNEDVLFSTDFIEITPNVSYVVNGYSASANRVYGACYNASKEYLTNVTTNANISTFIVTNTNAKYIRLTGFLTDIDRYQLEQGTTATTYEPYISESFPLSLKSRNLFDKDNANILKGWFRDATDEMVLNSTSTDRIIAFEGKPNTTYTISKKTSNRFRVDLYNSLLSQDGTYIFNYPIIKNDSGTSITVTTTPTDYYIYIHVYQSSDGDFQAILNSIQIEYGNTSTDYEPYYDINLCDISDYKDRIYSQNGEFYWDKKTSKVVFDGSESLIKSATTSVDRFIEQTTRHDMNVFNGLSNYFTYNQDSTNAGTFFLDNSQNQFRGRIIINFSSYGITTLEQFKTWLSTHNTEVQYVLATPTTEKITQENYPTLYSQLLAIQEFLTKYKINKEFLLDYSSPEIEY